MIKMPKFSNQCRACRRLSPKLKPLLSKLEDFDKMTIKKCIESLGLSCELSSNLPSKLCEFCIDELKITYIFNEKYRQSDQYFKNIVLQSMKEVETPENLEINDVKEDFGTEEYVDESEILTHEETNVEGVDVLEGYEELVEDECEEWLDSSLIPENDDGQTNCGLEEEDVNENSSQPMFEELEDIIIEEIDDCEPSVDHLSKVESTSEIVKSRKEVLHKRSKSTPKVTITPNKKKKMVFSLADLAKEEGSCFEIQQESNLHLDVTEELEQISVSKKQPELNLKDLEKRNLVATVKSIPLSKIEGGTLVIIDGETFHKCDECDRKFSKRYLLKSHIKSVHLRIREHCCSLCPKQFTSKLRLEEHFRTHTGERPFKCEYCPMAFTTPTQRKLHSITHTRSNPYSCEFCGKTFSSHATLHGHKFIHTRQGVECPVCKKMFARQVDVKKHMVVHTKEKSFLCKICDKGYLYNTSLKAHMKNHSFDNVQCKNCNEEILNIDQWNYHLQLHANKVFDCSSCGTTFMEQYELFTHLRTAHTTLDMTQYTAKETRNSWIDN